MRRRAARRRSRATSTANVPLMQRQAHAAGRSPAPGRRSARARWLVRTTLPPRRACSTIDLGEDGRRRRRRARRRARRGARAAARARPPGAPGRRAGAGPARACARRRSLRLARPKRSSAASTSAVVDTAGAEMEQEAQRFGDGEIVLQGVGVGEVERPRRARRRVAPRDRPAAGAARPASVRSSVVLPWPLAPRIQTIDRRRRRRSSPARTAAARRAGIEPAHAQHGRGIVRRARCPGVRWSIARSRRSCRCGRNCRGTRMPSPVAFVSARTLVARN